MSQHRISPDAGFADPKKDAEGRALCRRCEKPVPKGRRAWCGEECIHEHRIRTDPGYVRAQVEERDHGICATCGLDGERAGNVLRRWERMVKGPWFITAVVRAVLPPLSNADEHYALRQMLDDRPWRMLGKRGSPPWGRHALWDADHIVPVIEGGGECGLDNYRTLCWWCHRDVTAELHRRLAEKRAGRDKQTSLLE